MKNLFKKTMLFAAAAMAFVSCENDTTEVNTLPGIDITVNATVEGTKSHFGDYNATDKTYPTVWDGTENWYVAINEEQAEAQTEKDHITYSDDNTSATVNMTVSGVDEASTYTLYAISPSSARVSYSTGTNYRITIPTEQTPKATSCDPAAQILIAQSEPQGEPTSFNVTFKHATAYAKFSFVNLNLEDAIVSNVTIESELPFANRFDYKFEDKSVTANSASSTITLTDVDVTKALWFACAPVDLQGKKLTFTINTDKGPLTRVVTMPTGKGEFKSGVVAQFNIDMEGIEFEKSVKYELVTNASELAVGDEIIIADKGTANQAISTTQNNNNRAATTITKDGNYIVDPSNAVQIITLTEGTVAGTFGFKVGSQYLYAASSSSNNMKSQSTNNANGSWKVTIAEDGTATIVAQGSFTRNTMRFNPNNGTPIFSCYSGGQQDICIYKLPSTKPAIVASNIEVSAEGGNGEATYEIKNFTNDDVTGESNKEWLTAVVGSGEILWEAEPNYTGAVRSGEIVLTSAGAGVSKTITVSQAADVFEVSATEISLGADTDATAKFTVTSTHAFTLTNPDYDKVSLSVESGKGEVEVTVTILVPNSSGSEVSRGNIVVTRTGDNATKSVAVKQKAAGASAEPVTESLNIYGTSGVKNGTTSISWDSTNFTFTNNKAGSSTAIRTDDSNHYRAYKDSEFVITAKNNKKITRIVITYSSTSASYTYDISGFTKSGSTTVWTGSATEVTGTLAGQVRMNKVEVTLE